MVFDCLREKHGLKNGDNIQVSVDYTMLNDDFLILCASINVTGEKDLMLYFTARNYPKWKNQMDERKMELIFFKGLRHVLSKIHLHNCGRPRVCKLPPIANFRRFKIRLYFENKKI
jgi:hypothetical protein